MKPQLGPSLASSCVFPFAEIETGFYVAQVSLYINYVAEGDPHLCLDRQSAGITSVCGPGDGTRVHAHTLTKADSGWIL